MSSDTIKPTSIPETPVTPVLPPAPQAPKQGSKRGWWVVGFLILLAIALGEAVIILRQGIWKPASAPSAATERKVLYWQDPMHPAYKSDKPGKAPDCGMDLVPVYEESAVPKAPAIGERKILYWQDPMNPQHKSDKPGKAPDGMDLVPVYAEEAGIEGQPPVGAFKITPEKQQLIGVQYGEVALQPLTRTILAVARLAYDETRIVRMHSKIEGWIDKVYVDFTGQLVTKGQPLISVYSPELVATQDEYLLALRARERLGNSAYKEVSTGANSLLEAARKRLELWDISDQQIAEVERTKKPMKALTLYSPASGFILARSAYERQRITPETELYSIADLSTVWAIADFYEYEIRDVRLGQRVVLTLSSFPGRTFVGKVNYIYPQLDNTTRTLRVRAEFPNPDFTLKPDMYANAELKIDYGRRLALPQEAVLDSGTEQVVFVARDDGYFEPRKVVLGDRVDNKVIILSGLRAGEKVVTSGNFLVDSESKLKSAASGMGMPGMSHGGGADNQPQKPSNQATPQAPSMPSMDHSKMDHSKHQGGKKAPKKDEPMDHSKHQMKPEQNNHD
jgi:RND family efflux transporter MFP subunit